MDSKKKTLKRGKEEEEVSLLHEGGEAADGADMENKDMEEKKSEKKSEEKKEE